MTWKFFWQLIFLSSIIMFIFMFVKFSYSGFKDIKEMLKDKDE